jgi:hypothetical protein
VQGIALGFPPIGPISATDLALARAPKLATVADPTRIAPHWAAIDRFAPVIVIVIEFSLATIGVFALATVVIPPKLPIFVRRNNPSGLASPAIDPTGVIVGSIGTTTNGECIT